MLLQLNVYTFVFIKESITFVIKTWANARGAAHMPWIKGRLRLHQETTSWPRSIWERYPLMIILKKNRCKVPAKNNTARPGFATPNTLQVCNVHAASPSCDRMTSADRTKVDMAKALRKIMIIFVCFWPRMAQTVQFKKSFKILRHSGDRLLWLKYLTTLTIIFSSSFEVVSLANIEYN